MTDDNRGTDGDNRTNCDRRIYNNMRIDNIKTDNNRGEESYRKS
jgi:hypothetical protein